MKVKASVLKKNFSLISFMSNLEFVFVADQFVDASLRLITTGELCDVTPIDSPVQSLCVSGVSACEEEGGSNR